MSNGVAHGELVLFECPRVRRSEYWQFIKLVAPAGAPPPGQSHWLSQDAADAFCLKCSRMFRFHKGSSNAVRRHMERFHRKELARHQAQAQAEAAALAGIPAAGRRSKGESRGRPKRPAADKPALAPEPDSPPAPAAIATDQAAAKRPRRAAEQRDGEELLVRWLCAGLRPLSAAQDAALGAFVAFLAADRVAFQLPTLDAARHRLELLAEGLRFDARQALRRHAGRLSLSVELWGLPGDAAYAAVVGHTLSDDFVRVAVPLEVAEVPGGGGEDEVRGVRELVSAALRDWGLPRPLVSLALVPPSLEAEAGWGDASDVPWCHDVLTLLEGDFVRALSAGRTPPPARGAAPASTTPLSPDSCDGDRDRDRDARDTALAAIVEVQQLVRACQRLGAVRRKLVELRGPMDHGDLWAFDDHADGWCASADPASWIDWSRFLRRVLAGRATLDALFAFAATDGGRQQLEPALSSREPPPARAWLVVEAVAALLRPLEEFHDVLGGGEAGSPCVASLPFMLQCSAMLKQQLERDDLLLEARARAGDGERRDDGDRTLAQLELVRGWVIRQVLPLPRGDSGAADLGWCSTLDPRCARMRHLTDAERAASRATLIERAAELCSSQLSGPAAPAATEAAADPLADFDVMYAVGRPGPPPAQGLMHRLLYDDDDDAAATDGLSREAEAEHARVYAAEEVDAYLTEHQTRKARVSCPLEWWRANRGRYPLLAPLARVWLGAVASTGHQLRHALRPEVDRENRRRAEAKTTRDMIYVHVATRQQLAPAPPLSPAPSSWPVAAPEASQPSTPPFAV